MKALDKHIKQLIKALLAACEGQGSSSAMSYIVAHEAMAVSLGRLDMRVVDGMGKLLFEIAKGTTGLLHSRGEEVIGLVIKHISNPPIKPESPSRSAESTVEALGIISLSLCAEHVKPGKGSLILDGILLEVNKLLKTFSSQVVRYSDSSTNNNNDKLESALAVTNTCSAISRLFHILLVVLDRQDALILRSSPNVDDQLNDIMNLLSALVMYITCILCLFVASESLIYLSCLACRRLPTTCCQSSPQSREYTCFELRLGWRRSVCDQALTSHSLCGVKWC